MTENRETLLYLECTAGISGDMTVAALLDLGADEGVLRAALDSIPAEGFSIQISRVVKSGLDACDFNVILDAEHENHDHDMAYLYGSEPMEQLAPSHGHGHNHDHPHRNLKDVLQIIDQTDMTQGAKALAGKIFTILAEAEAKAHGTALDQVHFHEVGAIDSIVDIIAAAVCLDNLDIAGCIVTGLHEGRGSVRCQHGILPVPVPAVANIAEAHHLPLTIIDCQGELVTPTGAAFAAAVRTREKLPELFTIQKIGMGAGKREYPTSGILRAMLIQEGE